MLSKRTTPAVLPCGRCARKRCKTWVRFRQGYPLRYPCAGNLPIGASAQAMQADDPPGWATWIVLLCRFPQVREHGFPISPCACLQESRFSGAVATACLCAPRFRCGHLLAVYAARGEGDRIFLRFPWKPTFPPLHTAGGVCRYPLPCAHKYRLDAAVQTKAGCKHTGYKSQNSNPRRRLLLLICSIFPTSVFLCGWARLLRYSRLPMVFISAVIVRTRSSGDRSTAAA